MSPRPRLRFIFRVGLPANVQIYISSVSPPLRFIFRMGLMAKVQIYRSNAPSCLSRIHLLHGPARQG